SDHATNLKKLEHDRFSLKRSCSERSNSMQPLALFFLATVAVGGVVWVFIYPYLSGEAQVEKRVATVAKPDRFTRTTGVAATARTGGKVRREQVEESLKELEQRQKKAKSPPIGARISQAGLSFSQRQFYLGSVGLGIAVFAVAFIFGGGLLISPALAFAAGFGLPRWLLSYAKKRREN